MDWIDEKQQEKFNIPLEELDKKVAKICNIYGIASDPVSMRRFGMAELFDEDGNLTEDGELQLETAYKNGVFGDELAEDAWVECLSSDY